MKPPDDLFNRPVVVIVLLAALSVVPLLFMGSTAFVKIVTVLQIAKNAVGIPNVPSNAIVTTLAAALALIVMAPVGTRIWTDVGPLLENRNADAAVLVERGAAAVREPLRDFFKKNAHEIETARFFEVAKNAREAKDRSQVTKDDFAVVFPAFLVSELGEAFAIGFMIYLPFLVLDLVVANVLLALGMQMLSPTQVSLPLKLLLFVTIDGWALLSQSLVTGYFR